MPVQIETVCELLHAGRTVKLLFLAMDYSNMRLNTVQPIVGFVAMVAYESLKSFLVLKIIYFNFPVVWLLPNQERDEDFFLVTFNRIY